jgi:hypothetical protein
VFQGECEEDDNIASPGDEETALINDSEYEDREEKCEGDFDGHGSPINDCCGRLGAIRNMAVTNYAARSILLQGDEGEAVVTDMDTDSGVALRRDVDQHDDTDTEDKEKEETDEHMYARESSADDDEEDENPVSPVPDIESEVCKHFLPVCIFLFPYVDCVFANKRGITITLNSY